MYFFPVRTLVLYMGLFCIGIPKAEVHFKLVENLFSSNRSSSGCLLRCCGMGDWRWAGKAAVLALGGGYVRLVLLGSGHLSV